MLGTAAGHGGIARYRRELAARLAGQVEYVSCEVTAGPLAAVPLLRQLPLVLRGLDASSPLHVTQIIGAGVAWFSRLPAAVVTVHDLGYLDWPNEREMFTPAARALLKLAVSALRRAELVIAVSDFTARSLVQKTGIAASRVRSIHQGIDHTVFRPRAAARATIEERLGLGEWDAWWTAIVVGNDLPRKNLGLAFEIVALAKQDGRRLRLLKVGGSGGQRFRDASRRAVERLGVADRVHFLDGVDDDDLALLYGTADAYLCPSHLEGFSLPTVEAMACGSPVVVAARGSLPEVVGEAGVVMPPGAGASEWLGQLDVLFGDANLSAELRRCGVERAARFSWEETAQRTLAVYAELAALPAGRGRQPVGTTVEVAS